MNVLFVFRGISFFSTLSFSSHEKNKQQKILSQFCISSFPTTLFKHNSKKKKQMTQGNVGSLLVFDPAKAGAAGSGGAVAPGDAVVGIVTERGMKFSFFFFFFRLREVQTTLLHPRQITFQRRSTLEFSRLVGSERKKKRRNVLFLLRRLTLLMRRRRRRRRR